MFKNLFAAIHDMKCEAIASANALRIFQQIVNEQSQELREALAAADQVK